MIHNKELAGSGRNRSYGVHISGERKEAFLGYLAEWLEEVRGMAEDGREIRNIDYVYDIGLLLELEKFKDEGNFDRISAMCLGVMMIKELNVIEIEERSSKDPDNFFNRKLWEGDGHGIVEHY
jgi:hypothetical protein